MNRCELIIYCILNQIPCCVRDVHTVIRQLTIDPLYIKPAITINQNQLQSPSSPQNCNIYSRVWRAAGISWNVSSVSCTNRQLVNGGFSMSFKTHVLITHIVHVILALPLWWQWCPMSVQKLWQRHIKKSKAHRWYLFAILCFNLPCNLTEETHRWENGNEGNPADFYNISKLQSCIRI